MDPARHPHEPSGEAASRAPAGSGGNPLALDAAEALALDGWLAGERGLSIPWLMSQAGDRVAEAALALLRARGLSRVVVLEGPGNNGGDGVVAAARLAPEVETWEWRPLGRPAAAQAVSTAALAIPPPRRDHPETGPGAGPRATGHDPRGRDPAGRAGPVRVVTAVAAPGEPPLDARTLVIDALFGVGLARPLAGAARGAVERVLAAGAPVLAVDVPSGLDATTGEVVGGASGCALPAVATVTFVLPKAGLLAAAGPALAGDVRVVEIGFPAAEAVGWLRARRGG